MQEITRLGSRQTTSANPSPVSSFPIAWLMGTKIRHRRGELMTDAEIILGVGLLSLALGLFGFVLWSIP